MLNEIHCQRDALLEIISGNECMPFKISVADLRVAKLDFGSLVEICDLRLLVLL